MAEQIKTKPSALSVVEFLDTVPNEQRREDGKTLLKMMRRVTKLQPVMWGGTIVGFGSTSYERANGKTLDMLRMGFSPRSGALVLYLTGGLKIQKDRLKKLGKHKTGQSCLYINRLSDVDSKVLIEMIEAAWKS
jgi:hypothetical protein